MRLIFKLLVLCGIMNSTWAQTDELPVHNEIRATRVVMAISAINRHRSVAIDRSLPNTPQSWMLISNQRLVFIPPRFPATGTPGAELDRSFFHSEFSGPKSVSPLYRTSLPGYEFLEMNWGTQRKKWPDLSGLVLIGASLISGKDLAAPYVPPEEWRR